MKIATKALATIMLTAMLALAASSGASAASGDSATSQRNDKKLSRSYRKHDRKMELRAATLGETVDELKTELRDSENNFARVLKKHGFKNEKAFNVAMVGKSKDELKRRGWSDEKIAELVEKRLQRLS